VDGNPKRRVTHPLKIERVGHPGRFLGCATPPPHLKKAPLLKSIHRFLLQKLKFLFSPINLHKSSIRHQAIFAGDQAVVSCQMQLVIRQRTKSESQFYLSVFDSF
jgi:hypothetical protein